MLEADVAEGPDKVEAGRSVDSDRRLIGRIADDGDDLPEFQPLAFLDERFEKRRPDALPARFRGEIDRILDRIAIGETLAVVTGIAVAEHRRGMLRHEIGKAAGEKRLHAAF